MKRALSLWLPMWSVDVWRRSCNARGEVQVHAEARRRGGEGREATLITARVGQRREVVGCCARAQRAGVRAQMTVSDARALLGPVATRIVEHAPERDAAALGALARWAVRFSPRVAVDPPDGLLLDVTGCDRVHGGEGRQLARLIEGVERLGFCARGAIAPTFGCAWGVARFGESNLNSAISALSLRPLRSRPSGESMHGGVHRVRSGWIVPDDLLRKALHDLPTAALRIDEAAIAGLAEVGVERIGELLALPRGALRSRFGPELSLRLAQALGEAIETIEVARPAALLRAERLFDGPTARWEALAMVGRDLVDDLCGQLASRERGAMRVELILERSDAGPVVLEIQLAGPSRDRRHLWSLLRPKLERANMGFGVQRMELVARRSARIAHRQGVCGKGGWREDGAESQQRERQLAELVDALSSRLGMDRVLRAQMVESHIPERTQRMTPALRMGEVRGRKAQSPAVACGDRPTMLLPRPEPARVITVAPDGPVLSVRWRGEDLRIITSVGPERIEGEWWRDAAPPAGRDYFKVQDEGGRWLWVYRARTQMRKAEMQNAEVAEGAQRAQSRIGFDSESEGLTFNSRGQRPRKGMEEAPDPEGVAVTSVPGQIFDATQDLAHNAAARAAPTAPPSRSPGRRPGFKADQRRSPEGAAQLDFTGGARQAPRSLVGESDRDGMIPITSENGDPRRDLGGTGGGTGGGGWFVHGMWV